ncbi:MAG TPA: hypothetical protein PLD99_01165 [Parcubacteria group bacterium]|nr:hypothetical protein [Parcubacteria group bacterium]
MKRYRVLYAYLWQDKETDKYYFEAKHWAPCNGAVVFHRSLIHHSFDKDDGVVVVLGSRDKPYMSVNGHKIRPRQIVEPTYHMLLAKEVFREKQARYCAVCGDKATYTIEGLSHFGSGITGFDRGKIYYSCDKPNHQRWIIGSIEADTISDGPLPEDEVW